LHFAAKIVVPDSVADPLNYYLSNTVKTHALLQAAVRGNVKHFVFSSSAAVYGNPRLTPVCETADPAPLSPYGRSKLMSEYMLVDASAASDLRHVALRYFNVAGADPAGRSWSIDTWCDASDQSGARDCTWSALLHEHLWQRYPTPDGTCVRDYVHVSDLARAHLAALDHLRNGGESRTLNCGYGRGYSVSEVVDAVRMVAGVDFEIRQAPRRPGDPASIVADSDQLMKLGGGQNWMICQQ
jgi:UDP-glucose 4-epimerase